MPRCVAWFGLLLAVVTPRVVVGALVVGTGIGTALGAVLPPVERLLAVHRPVVVAGKRWQRSLRVSGTGAAAWPTVDDEGAQVEAIYVLVLATTSGREVVCRVEARRAWEVWSVGDQGHVPIGAWLGRPHCDQLRPAGEPPAAARAVAGS